jgi:hypothetical protein
MWYLWLMERLPRWLWYGVAGFLWSLGLVMCAMIARGVEPVTHLFGVAWFGMLGALCARRARVVACVLVCALLVACAVTPRQRALADCEHTVAHEMGFDVQPDGSWRPRTGGAQEKIVGSGARIDACLRARGY